ncbi:MAG: zinc ribbon domain-containing protein [Nitrososphaerota archaeon]
MDWYLDQSIKYWKNSSVISGAIAFIYLAQVVIFSAILELFKQSTFIDYSSRLIEPLFQEASAFSIIFFILFLIAGILTSRGNAIGAVMSLILSIIILLLLLSFSIPVGAGALGFLLLLALSPPALLSLFNMYYSIRALKNRIEGIAMSIYRFFSCSLQSSVAILTGIMALVTIGLGVFLAANAEFPNTSRVFEGNSSSLLLIGFILLFIAFILVYYSEHIIFNNDEETLPRKRIYFLLTASIFIFLIISGMIPIFGPILGLLTIPFTLFSLGFVIAMPKKELIMDTMECKVPSQVFPRMETAIEVPREHFPKPMPATSKVRAVGVKYCRYCGRIIPTDSIFCEYCGRRLR